MEKEKSAGELLQEKLFRKPKHGGMTLPEEELQAAHDFCEGYKKFLDDGKTEHEVVCVATEMLKANGYREFQPGVKYAPGDKLYYDNRGKAMVIITMGTRPLDEGLRIVAAHIDSPRLDLKPNPLYEDSELGFLKSHYYGGIKKYQWGTIPLAMHGTIVKKDGEVVEVRIGEDEGDPVFCVTDLLIHLAGEQMKRPLAEGIKGEELNILIGSQPFRDDKVSEKVKLNLANLLFEKYGVCEEDFLSAELEMVPAFKAKDLGLDRSLIGAYGHDDRVCAYPALMAALDVEHPAYTTMTILADKEEVGSIGPTGMQGYFFRYIVEDLAEACGVSYRQVLRHSACLSADVNAGYDPTFGDVYEKKNSAFLNHGAVMTKYTGARGKGGSNDATADYMARIRRLMDENNVLWQTGELGKVDAGGGGTVAMDISKMSIDTVDLGVPVLSMHAPFEVVSKVDVYSTYRACKVFYEEK